MIKYIINWIVSLWKDMGSRVAFTIDKHTVQGYMFTPPVYRNDKLIIWCHGGWATFPQIPQFADVDYYTRRGYNVFVLRYDDELTVDPWDLDIEKDILDVEMSIKHYKGTFTKLILLGTSRGGYVALQSAIQYDLFDAIVIGCAPSDIEAWDKWGAFKFLGEKPRPYFYKLPSPIKSAAILGKRKNLILIHGDEDELVPVIQSVDLTMAIMRASGTALLKLFMGRGHALMNDKVVCEYVADELEDL